MFADCASLPELPIVPPPVPPMMDATPHYLLRSEVSREDNEGRWRFVLRPLDGSADIAAADMEPGVAGERLDLLTVVRALESLDQPSWVTIIRCTSYVEQGVLYGLTEWKDNGWRWECFGQMAPVRDADLWQRMDRILQFHRVDCGHRRLDAGHNHALLQGPHWGLPVHYEPAASGQVAVGWVKCQASMATAWVERFAGGLARRCFTTMPRFAAIPTAGRTAR